MTGQAGTSSPAGAAAPAYTLWQLIVYFLRLGALGFGGPVALVGYMHRDLVERRAWITEADYREGLALAQLATGPMAAQTANYLGYVHYRIWWPTPGICCAPSSRGATSRSFWTASFISRLTTVASPRPVWWAYGPRPTVLRLLTPFKRARSPAAGGSWLARLAMWPVQAQAVDVPQASATQLSSAIAGVRRR
jgi:Chromate transporter